MLKIGYLWIVVQVQLVRSKKNIANNPISSLQTEIVPGDSTVNQFVDIYIY